MEAYAITATTSGVVGLLLAFRTNTAYDRWWEGRKLWGQLNNELRNLWLKVQEYVECAPEEKEAVRRLLVAFPQALKEQLRGHSMDSFIQTFNLSKSDQIHVPMQIARQLFAHIAQWESSGKINGSRLILMDKHARALFDVCGACERILRCPIAISYKLILWLWFIAYLLIVPWLLTPMLDLWTIAFMLFGNCFVLAIELLAEEVEEPFGSAQNDLPLDSFCQTIEQSLTY